MVILGRGKLLYVDFIAPIERSLRVESIDVPIIFLKLIFVEIKNIESLPRYIA
jgi:hypothetical protein